MSECSTFDASSWAYFLAFIDFVVEWSQSCTINIPLLQKFEILSLMNKLDGIPFS